MLRLLPLVALGSLLAGDADVTPSGPTFPSRVETIDGEALDLAKIARTRTVVVVTVKAPDCPVCQRQLERIRARLDALESCGVTFLVLAPGPVERLRELRDTTGFPYPFVADEKLEIAARLGLRLGADEIAPAILILENDLSVGWAQRGRSARFYGDGALAEQVSCWLSA